LLVRWQGSDSAQGLIGNNFPETIHNTDLINADPASLPIGQFMKLREEREVVHLIIPNSTTNIKSLKVPKNLPEKLQKAFTKFFASVNFNILNGMKTTYTHLASTTKRTIIMVDSTSSMGRAINMSLGVSKASASLLQDKQITEYYVNTKK